jgi:flagellar motor switch protein FliM
MSGISAKTNQHDPRAGANGRRSRDVHSYDFVRPACMAKEQGRTLQLVHESFAHKLAGVLSPPLRMPVHVTPAPARETTYADFTSELPAFLVTGVLRMTSECGPALVVAGCDTALFALDRLLGGGATALPEPRWLTEIECTLMEGVLNKLLGAYAETWRPLVEISGQVRAVTSSAMFSHVALPADIVCAAQFSLEMGSASGAFSLCLPIIACEPVLGELALQHWLASGRAQPGVSDELPEQKVTQVRVPVQAILGGARLTLSQVARLKRGDIVRLDRGANDEAEIIVGGRTKFFGRPGRTDGRLAVQITREAAPGEGTR